MNDLERIIDAMAETAENIFYEDVAKIANFAFENGAMEKSYGLYLTLLRKSSKFKEEAKQRLFEITENTAYDKQGGGKSKAARYLEIIEILQEIGTKKNELRDVIERALHIARNEGDDELAGKIEKLHPLNILMKKLYEDMDEFYENLAKVDRPAPPIEEI